MSQNAPEASSPSDTYQQAPAAEDGSGRTSTRLDASQFPHPGRGGRLPLTIENVQHLLSETGITAQFDVISKQFVVGQNGKPFSIIGIASVASQYGLSGGWLFPFVQELATRNPVNPVREWIDSKPWDGIDRLPDFLDTVHAVQDYPAGLKTALLTRWMLSAVAAATLQGRRFHSRGVLTLQGPQGCGKTTWINSLMPPGKLRDRMIKRDHHLDGGNKDSIIGAINHWIVEIGELDSSLKKDVARLKGFLTNDCDKLRLPYGRSEVEYDRRTVFAATVNDETFLIDHTGNSRFWTISVESLDFTHKLDMQQVFAQLRRKLDEGEQWWLSGGEEQSLARYNERHRSVTATAERIKDHIDLDRLDIEKGTYRTASEVLAAIGIASPSNRQCKECGSVLRELFGQPKRVNGRERWRVQLKGDPGAAQPLHHPDDEF